MRSAAPVRGLFHLLKDAVRPESRAADMQGPQFAKRARQKSSAASRRWWKIVNPNAQIGVSEIIRLVFLLLPKHAGESRLFHCWAQSACRKAWPRLGGGRKRRISIERALAFLRPPQSRLNAQKEKICKSSLKSSGIPPKTQVLLAKPILSPLAAARFLGYPLQNSPKKWAAYGVRFNCQTIYAESTY